MEPTLTIATEIADAHGTETIVTLTQFGAMLGLSDEQIAQGLAEIAAPEPVMKAIPPEVAASYAAAVTTTLALSGARNIDQMLRGHRYVAEWLLDNHASICAAYARIASLEEKASKMDALTKLRAVAVQPPVYPTLAELKFTAEWSADSANKISALWGYAIDA